MCKVVQYCTNIYPDLSFLAQLSIVGNAAELLNILVTLLWNSQTMKTSWPERIYNPITAMGFSAGQH